MNRGKCHLLVLAGAVAGGITGVDVLVLHPEVASAKGHKNKWLSVRYNGN